MRGEIVCALSLSTEDVPMIDGATQTGRASWVGPITTGGMAICGERQGDEIAACAVSLDAKDVRVEVIGTSGLRGFLSAYVVFEGTPFIPAGAPARIMAGARTLIAATALGIGSRALRESLAVAHRDRGAGGEQTVQGLLADTATELDAARLYSRGRRRPGYDFAQGLLRHLLRHTWPAPRWRSWRRRVRRRQPS